MTVENVDAATLKRWLDAGEAVLVDVREPVEYAAEHIEGAALIPLGQVCPDAVPDHAGRKLVMMCRLGGRGKLACEKMHAEAAAHEEIYNLEGGIEAWKKAGLPIEREERPASRWGWGFWRKWTG